jgi:hypothetical protein
MFRFRWLALGFGRSLLNRQQKELCVLGAGALGTTEILLRSKQHGLNTSLFLGQKVSGNGDILSFAYNTDEIVSGVGCEHPNALHPPGPTITGIIDNRNPDTATNVLDGYVIEEGVIPGALAPFVQTLFEAMPGKIYPPLTPVRLLRGLRARLQSRVFGPYTKGGSVDRTQTYLLMSHDSNEGILALQGNKPLLQFVGVGKTERVSTLRDVMANITGYVGGTLVDGPLSAGESQPGIPIPVADASRIHARAVDRSSPRWNNHELRRNWTTRCC